MTAVVVVAAGDGVRLGLGVPKALAPLGGSTVLEIALAQVRAAEVDRIVVVAPPAAVDEVRARVGADRAQVVVGGATRQSSVAAALEALPDGTDVVLVHDAARPLTPAPVFDLVRAAVRARGHGVVPALTPADTVKRVDAGGLVEVTLDRSRLAAVQTPQGFPFGALRAAHRAATAEHTDDAALFAAAGGVVSTVPGEAAAFKITTRWDLARAEDLLRPAGTTRIGLGIDVHAFDARVPLRLGGLDWPGPGLAGHSDGDAVCHAVADALLSAAGLGDLGSVFGVDRPEEAGRAGVEFVRRAVAMLRTAGAVPDHVTVQVVAQAPRIAARREEMQRMLSDVVGAPVSVSGTTTDGLGFTGRGEGLTAVASALVTVGGGRGARP